MNSTTIWAGISSLLDFRSTRPWYLALAFYVFHVIVAVLLAAITGAILTVILNLSGIEQNKDAFLFIEGATGFLAALFYCVAVFLKITWDRAGFRNPLYLAALVAVLGLDYFHGAPLALLPSAIALLLPQKRAAKEPALVPPQA